MTTGRAEHFDGSMAAVARFIAAAEVDESARACAARAVVDTLAVMVAGGVALPVRMLEQATPAMSQGTASFWSGSHFAPQDAAVLYGMAAHMLDYDDVSMLTICHPTAPVLSALLAAHPWERISGKDLLDALVIGTEVMIRLGETMGFRHYDLGFHATSALGTIGAAAACARLKRLDAGKTAHALSIAASMASGLRKNFGSMVKPLHVGIAAANGLKAVMWADTGLEGAAEIFDGGGFIRAFSGGQSDVWPSSIRPGEPFAIVAPGFERKRYPCCYLLHKIVESTLGIAAEANIDLDSFAGAHIEMPQGGSRPLIHPRPRDGLEARFSAPYAVLACIADRKLDLASVRDDAVMRSAIQMRLSLVTMEEREGPVLDGREIEAAPVTVRIRTIDGAQHVRTLTVTPGSADDPVTDPQLHAKWLDCFTQAGAVAGRDALTGLFERGLALQAQQPVSVWLADVRGALVAAQTGEEKRIVQF